MLGSAASPVVFEAHESHSSELLYSIRVCLCHSMSGYVPADCGTISPLDAEYNPLTTRLLF